MTTPANFNTPDRIIRMALKDAGLLQEGDDPSSEQFADALNRLNDLINFEQTQGLKLWLQHDLEVTLVSGQAKYSIGSGGDVDMTKPTRVLDSCYYLDVNSISRPIRPVSRDEYTRLSNRTQTGQVVQYFTDKLKDKLDVYFWLVPDATAAAGTAHLLIQQQVGNVVSLTDDMTFPLEWFLWARWALASDLATGQPRAIMDRCLTFAEGYRSALQGWDVEDASTFFTMDPQSGYSTRPFR